MILYGERRIKRATQGHVSGCGKIPGDGRRPCDRRAACRDGQFPGDACRPRDRRAAIVMDSLPDSVELPVMAAPPAETVSLLFDVIDPTDAAPKEVNDDAVNAPTTLSLPLMLELPVTVMPFA